MSKTTDYLTVERARACADQLINQIIVNGDNDNLEVDFNISKGKMVEPLSVPNTWFKIDISEGPLREVIDFLSEVWADEDTTESDAEFIKGFEKRIAEFAGDSSRHGEIASKLRSSVFKGVPEFLLPIEKILFHRVELASESEQGYILKVEKFAKVDKNTGEYKDSSQSVAKDLLAIHAETGRPFKEIIEEKRLEGDSRFEYVADAHLERYVRDVTAIISADYSFCENPAHERQT